MHSSSPCHRRTGCRLCGGTRLVRVLKLAPTPPANAFVSAEKLGEPQETFPLDVFFCEDCAHVQLLDVVDPRVLFENYVYVSGTSPVFVKHFEDYAAWVMERFAPAHDGLALDIGSNDGTLLRFFQRSGMRVLGVDPAREIARKASESGIETLPEFFNPLLAGRIRESLGAASIITANNVFAHADDLAGIVEGVRDLLSPEGVFVFEVSYLADVFEKTLFDTIYHEHVAYHSVGPLVPFFQAHGMELIQAHRVDSHGGSLRGVARRNDGSRPGDGSVDKMIALERGLGLDRAETLQGFGTKIDRIRDQLGSLLRQAKAEGKSIAGFGAPAKATTLMHHFGIGTDLVDFIVDDSPLKQGLFTPGLHVPVLPSQAIYDRHPDLVVILAWNFARPIMDKHAKFREDGGRFIVPLPDVEIF